MIGCSWIVGSKGLRPLVTTIGARKINRCSITSNHDDPLSSIALLILDEYDDASTHAVAP